MWPSSNWCKGGSRRLLGGGWSHFDCGFNMAEQPNLQQSNRTPLLQGQPNWQVGSQYNLILISPLNLQLWGCCLEWLQGSAFACWGGGASNYLLGPPDTQLCCHINAQHGVALAHGGGGHSLAVSSTCWGPSPAPEHTTQWPSLMDHSAHDAADEVTLCRFWPS